MVTAVAVVVVIAVVVVGMGVSRVEIEWRFEGWRTPGQERSEDALLATPQARAN